MPLSGEMLIAGARVAGREVALAAVNPATGVSLAPEYGGASMDDVDAACRAAAQAFAAFRKVSHEDRARFLDAVASNIQALGEPLIDRVMAETALPRGRVEGEIGRTANQLRLFASTIRDGAWLDLRIDPALPDRMPAPRPDLRMRKIPLGPVVVFGASNFPLAFSVAGGDTASAFAAGCPVVVKAHPAHPGTSELVAGAIQAAVEEHGLPAGIFSILYGAGHEIGRALVSHPLIKAVAFTGSRAGGVALARHIAARPEPIPFFAEMSSINPVILFPVALARRGPEIARSFAASLSLGSGQFCTNPGLILLLDSPPADRFVEEAALAVSEVVASPMLTAGIHAAYQSGVGALASHPAVRTVARGADAQPSARAVPALFETRAENFADERLLHQEVFGPSSLVVRCADIDQLAAAVDGLEGQLTIAVHADAEDHALVAELMPLLEEKAGRILLNGFGTGVEVADAMVHGGPWPATSDSRSTSVGSLAIDRFLRPVAYQDMPASLLPEELRDGNPLGYPRRVGGAAARP